MTWDDYLRGRERALLREQMQRAERLAAAPAGWVTCVHGHGPYPDASSSSYVPGECPHAGQFVCGYPLLPITPALIDALRGAR